MLRRCLLIAAVGALLATTFGTPGSAGPAPAPTVEDGIVVTSFDGTPIVATLMLPPGADEEPVPVVLETHGWGGSRRTVPGGLPGRLLEHGYGVLTWDSRGFGDSGGEANVGAPEFEVRDVQALLDYLALRPEVALDGPGDPRVGWIGGSNAGGVQLNAAAVEDRVDAIVPEIAWGDLVRDLVPGGVPKQTWDLALYGAGAAGASAPGLDSPAGPQTGVYASKIHQGFVEIAATGSISEDVRRWFAHRSTTRRSDEIEVPTMLVQGSVDTLFPLEGAFENYLNIRSAGTPVKLVVYCSGHTLTGCPYPGGASGYPDGSDRPALWQERAIAWLDRYVRGLDVDTGPEVEWQAQDGLYYAAPRFPLPGTRALESRRHELSLVGPGSGGGDGPADGNPAPAPELQAGSAVRVPVLGPVDKPTPVLGVPEVEISGSVTGVAAHLFFELVDVSPNGERVTVDDQVMPVALGSGAFEDTVALHGVAWILEPGHQLELEIATSSASYQVPRRGPFAVDLAVAPRLPVAVSGALQRSRIER